MERRIVNDKQRRWLNGELAAWQRDGVVSPEDAGRIEAYYETPDDASQRKRLWFTFAISSIAAILVGLAAFLVIGYNWSVMPRPAKLAIVFFVVIVTHAVGLWLKFARGARKGSEIVTLLGCLFFGAGIWLVAQAFHLDSHWPDGFFWWAMGVLPFALAGETLLIHCLYAALLAAWAGSEVIGYGHIEAWLFWGLPVPNGAYGLPVLVLPVLLWAYRRRAAGAVSLYVPVLSWWVCLQSIAWHANWQVFFVVAAVGALLLTIAENHEPGNRMSAPYRFWGTALAACALVPISFGSFYESPGHWGFYRTASSPLALFVLLPVLLVIALALAVSRLFRSRAGGQVERLSGVVRAQWLPLGLLLAVTFAGWWAVAHNFGGMKSDLDWIPPTVVANMAMLALALWLMGVGLRDDRGLAFAFGVVYFLAWALCRYSDLFGAAGGMLGAALMFFICGAALFGLARFWSRRRVPRATGKVEAADAGTPGLLWLDAAGQWLGMRERGLLYAFAGLQVVVLVAMIVQHAAPLVLGETIRLTVRPVDPRDMMRGDFVILSYDISRVPDKGIEGIPDASSRSWRYWDRDQWLDERTVYVTLEPDAGGKLWHAVKAGVQKPVSGRFIRGKYLRQWGTPAIQFGIEAFYVQEGAGKKLEEARNANHLVAEVALLSSGKATLRDLVVEEK